MASISDEQLRNEYHALCESDRDRDILIRIPDSFEVPRTFNDFHRLSCLLRQGQWHGSKAIEWMKIYISSKDLRQESIRKMCLHMAGLKLLLKGLAYPVHTGILNLFDIVSTETPSIHVQLFERMTKQYRAILGAYIYFQEMGPLRMAELPPVEFIAKLQEFKLGDLTSAPEADFYHDESRVRAELARLEFHLRSRKPRAGSKLSGNRPCGERDRLWLKWEEYDDLSSKEIAARWNAENPFDRVSDGAVRQALVRARRERQDKSGRDEKRDKL